MIKELNYEVLVVRGLGLDLRRIFRDLDHKRSDVHDFIFNLL